MRLLKEEVRAWLKSKPEYELVGKRGYITDCPLACFLRDVKHDPDPVIGGYSFDAADGGNQPMPGWATAFITRIDAGGDGGYLVTAAEALEALDKK